MADTTTKEARVLELEDRIAWLLCCGKDHCDAVNPAADNMMAPDRYVEKYGCDSKDAREKAAAIAKLFADQLDARDAQLALMVAALREWQKARHDYATARKANDRMSDRDLLKISGPVGRAVDAIDVALISAPAAAVALAAVVEAAREAEHNWDERIALFEALDALDRARAGGAP